MSTKSEAKTLATREAVAFTAPYIISRWRELNGSVYGGVFNAESVKESDFGDFDRRLREHERVVYQIAYRVLGNAADAEDVTQDVFLRAYRNLASLRAPEKFRAWVARMSRRLALNRLRDATRSARRDTAWSEGAVSSIDVEAVVADREFHARLRDEIERLPEKLRTVLHLCAVERLPVRSVATMLEIPEGTVRSRLHLARKQLLRAFSP
jgi:RNA polymerase sigma-70 factor, ECF subfamily